MTRWYHAVTDTGIAQNTPRHDKENTEPADADAYLVRTHDIVRYPLGIYWW